MEDHRAKTRTAQYGSREITMNLSSPAALNTDNIPLNEKQDLPNDGVL
jgi:hypothetical protein